ncbi:hypothetical protein [Streptomyces carpinensis]|uniref:Uncharacterized protein n=1 Tax=Streptomyces carpinensis TaxID=66369 RepID=A0ABV1WEI1_9ACTN|nr:hypothetical protein [Streptomyces carpinensis]
MSPASSEAATSGAPARIPPLAGLGTSWYERGKRGVACRGLLAPAAPVVPASAARCAGRSVATLTVREHPGGAGGRRALEAR